LLKSLCPYIFHLLHPREWKNNLVISKVWHHSVWFIDDAYFERMRQVTTSIIVMGQ
jgi:hypothetical protein